MRQRLRRLNDRVLRLNELSTEAGWRRNAARWRWTATLATLCLGVGCVTLVLGYGGLAALIPVGGSLAFNAGRLKAEDDRLNKRGRFERARPPGL